ncbi:MAG: hypothetical protein F7C35_00820 [Desulfurococcales archaeon]|nr:hypothetical protein [Desulfurococcales archaeon]
MPSTSNNWYGKAIAKWALILADEIEEMLPSINKRIKRGELQDALHELGRVLVLASEDDLAEEARDLKRLVEEIASTMLVREGYYYQAMNIHSIRERIRGLIQKVRERLGQ